MPLCLCVAILILTLTGCTTLAPKYDRPTAPVSAAWPQGPAYAATGAQPGDKPAADIPWQQFFTDRQLSRLIAMALENNRDLAIASLNIERAQAQYQIQRADLLPKVDASAGGNFQRVPAGISGSGKGANLHQYTVGLGVSAYELDLFGRVRSLKEQALEQFLATEQARRGVQISLIGEVASAYLTLAADRERLKLARETLANQQAAFQLVQSRYDAGVANALSLSQARTSVEAARLDVARYTTLTAQDRNLLELLVGAPVPDDLLPGELSANLTSVGDLRPGLPSEVLLRRPDILQAEELLKGANANIGAARAAFFPRVTLVSSVGLGSDQLSGLFTGNAFAWSFGPKITLPIFEAGANRAALKVSKVDRDIAVARYQKAIQTAFREVSDALALRGTIEEQLASQQALVAANADSYRLSQARFDKGVDSYLNVLDSQRSLYGAQQILIGVRLARLNSLVTLYKVLGGGS